MRRRELLGVIAAAAASRAGDAHGLGRTKLQGSFEFSIPWKLSRIDPHDFTDPIAALFAPAIADTMFIDTRSGPQPALAQKLPEAESGGVKVLIRTGLRTANNKALDSGDILASIKRIKARGGGVLFDGLEPAQVPGDPFAVFFKKTTVGAVRRALASPLAAILPRDFDPAQPDGTGALRATFSGGSLRLERNTNASMGPSFLDSIVVREAADLRESLRDFDVGRHDLGWLGLGLGGRTDVQAFDLGSVGAFVLAATARAGELAKPGNLQALVDELPRPALAGLGLGSLPAGSSNTTYDGPAIDLCVESSGHPASIAEAIATVWSRTDHEVTVKKVSRDELEARRARGDAMLSLHAVRGLDRIAVAMAALEGESRAAELAKGAALGPREAGKLLRVAFVGELRVSGGRASRIHFKGLDRGGWDLGASTVR
ncbi:MAG: hypothetical protein U0271_19735 [Polyangiaceae bacterium]